MINRVFTYQKLIYFLSISVMLCSQKAYSQSYFRKYIDSDEHCHEFNNQVMLKGDSIYLMNFISCDSLSQPFSSLIHLDFKGNLISSRNLPTIKTNYNSASLNGNSIFVAGSNNLNSPDSYFELLNIDIETEVSEAISMNLLDSTNNIYLNPIGSIHFGESKLIYGQYQENDESTVKGFLLWLDEDFYKDSVMTFTNDKDWSIISDAVVDNNDNIVILLEEVKIIENVEHHYRVIQKYNASKELVFEWISEPFYSNQGQGNITVLNSGLIVMEFVSSENEYIHSLVAIDDLGTIEWNYEFPLNEPYSVYRIFDLITSQSDDIILAGTYRNLDENIIITGYLAKVSKEGELLWERIFVDRSKSGLDDLNFSGVIQFQSIAETPTNDIVIGGRIIHLFGEPEENSDIFLAITDPYGCLYLECKEVQDISGIGNFLSPEKTWTEEYEWNDNKWAFRYTFDTIPFVIEGKIYYELLRSDSEFSNNWNSAGTYMRYEGGLVFQNGIGGVEQMIYNFNLLRGDTFFMGDGINNLEYLVESIDTISLLNGELKKRWTLEPINPNNPNADNTVVWVEDIGNLNGLLTNYIPWIDDAEYSTILCVKWLDNIVYDNPYVDSCWIITTSTNEAGKQDLIIFPNPANDEISILGFEHKIERIQIYNIYGELVFQGRSNHILLNEFSEGYYYIVIQLKNFEFKSLGFIKI